MELVLLTAVGVGGATVIGSVIGFIFKKISHKFSDIVLSFAAGVMLAAAVLGLIIPSLEYGGRYGIFITVAGIFAGAVCLNLIDKLVPHLHKFAGAEPEAHNNGSLSKVLLFVLAIAIHNLPEGIAAGVGFGSGDTAQALVIAGGIALQNIAVREPNRIGFEGQIFAPNALKPLAIYAYYLRSLPFWSKNLLLQNCFAPIVEVF